MQKTLKLTLAAARVNAGLTLEQACTKLAVSKKTLWNWEHGVTAPSVDKAKLICELYKVHYDDIIFLTNS